MAKFLLALAFCFCLWNTAFAVDRLRLATTTSTENSGLLTDLLPPFERAQDCRVDVIAVGTGKAIRLGQSGDVDVILVHARSQEDQFIAAGYGVDRRDVMYNDFVLLGPAADPAGIRGSQDAVVALRRIAASQSDFVSRGDDSGTHARERQLWALGTIQPAGDWYLEAGRGMGEVIIMANERQGYALSDRGTFLAFKDKIDLQIVVAGDERLYNPYGVIMVNPQKQPQVNSVLASKFLAYLVSAPARELIRNFKRHGEQLFYVMD